MYKHHIWYVINHKYIYETLSYSSSAVCDAYKYHISKVAKTSSRDKKNILHRTKKQNKILKN